MSHPAPSLSDPAPARSATAVPVPSIVASAPKETLAGLVERVTFHNEANGFCVLRVKARGQRDLVTVVGRRGAPCKPVHDAAVWLQHPTVARRRVRHQPP